MPRELHPCGTIGAYERHRRRGEKPCDACREAKRRYGVEFAAGLHGPRPVLKCGTYSGYISHVKKRQEVCQPCRDAFAAYRRNYRAEKRAAKGVS